jgi:uncharacterized protein YcbK (DUF882 family)
LFRHAVLALALLLIPGFARAAARAPAKTSIVKAGGTAGSAKASKKLRAKASKKPKRLSRYAPVELFQVNTKERLKLRFYDDRGRPIRGWQKRFNRFMRCHQTGKVFRMDVRLARILYQIGRHFEGHRLEVVSGFRHPKVAKNPKSPHKQGLACDFRVAGISNAVLRDYLRKTFKHTGVGYYPNSVFVHLDNRRKGPSAFWIDYAGPGEEASYAENPREDLRNGRADHKRGHVEEEAGRSEGADDMALAGVARLARGAPSRGENTSGWSPVEIKAPPDTFGD